MKKIKIISLVLVFTILLSLLPGVVQANKEVTYIFEESLRIVLQSMLGKQEIYESDLSEITTLNLRNKGITYLGGIGYFKNLKTLDVSWNQLTGHLDFGQMKSLESINCRANKITGLSVSENLKSLDCRANEITSLDYLIFNTNLESIDCSQNQLTSLKIGHLTSLKSLLCEDNQLTTLDVGGLTNLQTLNCGLNKLTSLDVGGLTNLQTLECYSNNLTSLDVGGLTNLKRLDLRMNQVTMLDVSKLTLLQELLCSYNKLALLDVTGLNNLFQLECRNNYLSGVKGLSGVTKVYLYSPQNTIISSTNIGSLPSSAVPHIPLTLTGSVEPANATYHNIVWSVDNAGSTGATISGNKFTAKYPGTALLRATIPNGMGVSRDYFHTFTVSVRGKDITSSFTDPNFLAAVKEILSISSTDPIYDTTVLDITDLDVSLKSISSLAGIEHFTSLKMLTCNYNPLNSFALTSLTSLKRLETLSCSGSHMTKLDVSGIQNLRTLDCSNNRMTELNVSGLQNLGTLICDDNQLTKLDVSGLQNLRILDCSYNKLTNLDVSGLQNLRKLICSYNYLTEVIGLSGVTETIFNPQMPSYIPVTNIANVPLEATVGVPLTLTSTVFPDNASQKSIVWSFDNVGPFARLTGDRIYAFGPCTIILRATIPKGISETEDYTQTFKIVATGGNDITESFPDPNFRREIRKQFRLADTDPIYDSVLEALSFNLANKNISSLKGIELFSKLQRLYCNNNQLTSLDLKSLPDLQILNCSSNKLTSLDISGLKNLKTLYCSDNYLTQVTGLTSATTCTFNPQNTFTAVTGINDLPYTATTGVPLTLTGTVAPTNASLQTIVWSVDDAGGTGAAVNGNSFTAKSYGTAKMRATITNGQGLSDYTKTFTINVMEPFKGYIDKPAIGETCEKVITVSGWALDTDGVSKVEVLIDNVVVGNAVYGDSRPDVKAVYPNYNNGNAGFHFNINVDGFAIGKHSAKVRVISSTNKQNILPAKDFYVSRSVKGNIEFPISSKEYDGAIKVSGWVLDLNTVQKVEILLDGAVAGEAVYGSPRADVYTVYPEYNNKNSGYTYVLNSSLAPGKHILGLRETSITGKQTLVTTREFYVKKPPFKGLIDTPNQMYSYSGSLIVNGWVLNTDSIDKIEVLVDNILMGHAVYGDVRQDVYNVYPEYNNKNSGFHYLLDTMLLTEGKHTLKIITTSNGVKNVLPTRDFVVTKLPVKGNMENPKPADLCTGITKCSGWILDPSGVKSIEILVDDVLKGTATYGSVRSDVMKVYPEYNNANCGYQASIDTTGLTSGLHTIKLKVTGNNDGIRVFTYKITVK